MTIKTSSPLAPPYVFLNGIVSFDFHGTLLAKQIEQSMLQRGPEGRGSDLAHGSLAKGQMRCADSAPFGTQSKPS